METRYGTTTVNAMRQARRINLAMQQDITVIDRNQDAADDQGGHGSPAHHGF